MSLPAIKFEAPAEDEIAQRKISELQVFSHSLRNLILRGLTAPTIEAWSEYWQQPEQWVSFVDFSRALRRALEDLELHEDSHRKGIEDVFWTRLTESHASKAADLQELRSKLAESNAVVRTVLKSTPLRSDELKTVETELIRRFNSAQHWISIGVHSLQLVVEASQQGTPLTTSEHLVEGILEISLGHALDALHTANEGAQLRVPPADKVFATFTSKISATEDGQGFIGACDELELMTCGATREEVHKLVIDLVIGYLSAEARRGNLGRILTSQLRTSENPAPSHLSLRLPIIDGDSAYCAFVEMKISV